VTGEKSHPDENEKLTEEAARRVLVRASQIEAARTPQMSVAELRAVASEAGITPSAVDQALTELRANVQSESTKTIPSRRTKKALFWLVAGPGWVIGALVAAAMLFRMLDL
jgi:hypothetical protein